MSTQVDYLSGICHCCGCTAVDQNGKPKTTNICWTCIKNGGCAGSPGRKCILHSRRRVLPEPDDPEGKREKAVEIPTKLYLQMLDTIFESQVAMTNAISSTMDQGKLVPVDTAVTERLRAAIKSCSQAIKACSQVIQNRE